jgi:hypothetical protein
MQTGKRSPMAFERKGEIDHWDACWYVVQRSTLITHHFDRGLRSESGAWVTVHRI